MEGTKLYGLLFRFRVGGPRMGSERRVKRAEKISLFRVKRAEKMRLYIFNQFQHLI